MAQEPLSTPQSWASNYQIPSDIEAPIASARPNGEKDSGLPINEATHSSAARNAGWRARFAFEDAFSKQAKDIARYNSLHDMNHADKIKALKDKRIDPAFINDGYDSLAASLHRWSVLGNSKAMSKFTPEQKQKIAENYYNHYLKPAYAKLNSEGVSPELWKEQAFGQALKFNIEDAYGSYWKQGLFAGFKGYENIAKFGMTSLVGGAIEGLDFLRGMVNTARPGHQDENFIAKVQEHFDKRQKAGGTWGVLQKDVAETPGINSIYHTLDRVSKEDGFWHDVLPPDSKWDRAKSFIAEQGMMLPFWGALGKFTSSGIATLGSENLTRYLTTKTSGKLVSTLLTGGAEGAAYGLATRDDGDKKNWWQDALGAAIGNTIFHVGGKSVKSATEAANNMVRKSNLAKAGLKEASEAEMRSAAVVASARTMAAGGRLLVQSVDEDALRLVTEGEGKIPGELARLRQQRLKEDPARWTHVYTKANYIKQFLAGKKLSELKPDEMALLVKELHDIANESADRIHEIPEVAQEVASRPNNTKGKAITRQKIMQDLMAADREAGAQQRPIQHYMALAEEEMQKRQARATKQAAARKAKKPIESGIEVAKKRDALEKQAPKISFQTTRSVNRFGEPSVSFKANTDFISYFKNNVVAAGKKWDSKGIREFLSDMAPEDFEKDLYDHFFPKDLKDMGLFFESEAEKGLGRQNPNFLAFMYNYTDQMPKEFGEKLSAELEDRMKFEKNFDPKTDVEDQKEYYAKGMWNHVADFLHSPSFESGERNIYRTTLERLKRPTKWQAEIQAEVAFNEKQMIKEMFSGDKEGYNNAMTAWYALNSTRREAFRSGAQEIRKQAIEGIDDILTRTGERDKVNF